MGMRVVVVRRNVVAVVLQKVFERCRRHAGARAERGRVVDFVSKEGGRSTSFKGCPRGYTSYQ